MKKDSDKMIDGSFYSGERASFTADDVVKYHVGITKKFVVKQDEVKLTKAYGEKGYRKGLYDFPNSIVSWGLTEIDPGGKSPFHRQLHEATHYILEGKGYSIINGKRIDWEEGDVVFVPLHSWHAQGNEGKEKVRYVTGGTIPFFRYLGVYRKENDREPLKEEMALLKKEMPKKLVVKKKDWYKQASEKNDVTFGFPYTIGTNRMPSPIPARSESFFVHRHFNEALIYVTNGHGFSLVHDRKIEWEKGSVIRIPTFAWHHHYNEADEPVVYLKNITSGLNNHLRWIMIDNFPPKDIKDSPLAKVAKEIKRG